MARSSMFLRWTNDNMEAGSRRTFTQEEVRFGLRWWLLWVDNAGLSKVCIFNTTGFKRTNEFFCILISVLLSWRLFCWLIRVLMYYIVTTNITFFCEVGKEFSSTKSTPSISLFVWFNDASSGLQWTCFRYVVLRLHYCKKKRELTTERTSASSRVPH